MEERALGAAERCRWQSAVKPLFLQGDHAEEGACSWCSAAARVVCQASDEPPSMAQTAMRGPLTATGSGKPLTAEELEACREELEEIKVKYGLLEPERAHMDEEGIK